MNPSADAHDDCPENEGQGRFSRCRKVHVLRAVLGVAAVVSSISAFRTVKHGKWSNISGSAASATAQRGFISQAQLDTLANARTLLCVASLRTSYAAQIPSNLCTYLVYTDVYFNPRADSFSPVNEATLSAFENASNSSGTRVLAAVGSPSLPELAQSASLVRRVGEAATRWLVARGFRGLAFVNYRTTTDKLEELAGPLEELQSTLSSYKLEIALSLSLRDWLSPIALISTRLYSIAQHVNLLVLQTHYYVEESKCKTAFPTVYSASREEPVTVPITSALGWINTLKEDFKVRASVCFSLSLGVYVFSGASTISSECKGVRQRGYDTVCDSKRWEKTLPFSAHGGASINRKNEELASYEDATISAKKVNTAIQKTTSACVAVFDVDMDDYEGVCGAPFARLHSLHRAMSLDKATEEPKLTTTSSVPNAEVRTQPKCGPRKGNRRPLLCILSERTDRKRTVSREHCTHFVYSLRHMEYDAALRAVSSAVVEDFSGADVPLLVALDERALERVPGHDLAQQTSALFRRYGLLGLALLYVAMPVADAALLPALVILHTTYKENNLCLLFSVQVLTDSDDTGLIVPSIRQIARLTDMFVLNTHYAGFVGPCRVMPASTLHEERKTCIPTLPMDTAAEWLRQIEEEGPQGPLLFVSVDMRAFRYRVYQRPSLEASCNLEEHVEYAQVCNGTGWRQLEVHATATTVAAKDNEVLSFESPESMKTAALTVRRASRRGSVAVFNVDFEDWQGSCRGKPYPRLSALRDALDSAEIDLPVTVEEGSGNRSRELVLEDDEPATGRPLVCVVSGELYDVSQVPDRLCTHIVHPGLSVDLNERTVFLSDRALRLAWSLKHSRHLAALAGGGSSALVTHLERSGPRTASYVALQAAGFLRRHALHGLALLNLARTTAALVKFAQIFRAMRSVLHADLQILLSVEVLDIHVPPKLLAKRMKDLVKEVDILVFETHFYHSRGYCQMEPPSSFEAPRKAFTVSMRMAMSWMEALNQSHGVCLSVNMAVLQFTSTDDRPSCERRSDVGYSETCDVRDWKIMTSNSSFSAYRRKETIWQFYEEPKLLKNKVSKLIAHQPAACVVAFNIDYDDYKPACGNTSFPRLAAIEEAYNQADGNVSDVRALQNSPYNENAIKDIFRMTGYLNSRRRRPLGVKQNFVPPKPVTRVSNESGTRSRHRPFVCLVSSSWSQLHALPRRHCTHYVFDPAEWDHTGASTALNVSDVREYVGSRKRYYIRIHPSYDEDEDAFKRIVRRVTVNGLDGVAIVEQKFFSTEFTALAIFVKLLKRRLSAHHSIILGVEVQDYDEDPAVVLRRFGLLFSLSEVVILQTHFTRSWTFCKTAYPSMYTDTGDGCGQSVPMRPEPVCDREGLETQDDRYGAAYRYVNEEWLSYETEHLLATKMRAAKRLHPSFCVAVFNVDYDAPGTQCSKKRTTPFFHLEAIAEGAGYRTVKDDEKKAPDSKYIDVTDAKESPTLVCVVHDGKYEVAQLPEEGCHYYVYQSVIYKDNETFVPRSGKAEFFNRFATAKSREEDAKFLVALDAEDFMRHSSSVARGDEWFAHFIGQLVLFLEKSSMDGVALVELPLTLADLDRLTPSLAAVRRYTAHFGYLYLLGVTLRDSGNTSIAATLPRIAALSRLADVVVLESHLVAEATSTPQRGAARNSGCTINFPNSAHASTLGVGHSMSLEEAGRVLRRLERTPPGNTQDGSGENEAILCFSLSLAAFRFRVDNNTKGLPGQVCHGFDMVPFRETCVSSQHNNFSGETVSQSARSSYRVAPGTVITFDSVTDIEHKLLSTVRGLTCGAVYAVNFDELEPVCSASAGIKAFPRLQAVINSIAVASTADEEEDAGYSTTPSVTPAKTRATHAVNATGEGKTSGTTTRNSTKDGEKRLICTVANLTSEILQSDGWKACSHLIFSSLIYDDNSSGLVTKDEESLKAFLSLRNNSKVKLAIELDIAELLETQLNAGNEQVAVATLFWMHKHGLERLALFVRNPGYSEMHLRRLITLIKMFRTSLRTVLADQIREVIAAVPLQRNVPVTELLQYADTIIYITHHLVPSENCMVLFPSTFEANFSFSDVERGDLLPPGATGTIKTRRFCVSVNMAVLRFLVNDHISSVVNSTCFGESWVPYEQICLEGEATATYDAESMAVLKHDDGYAFTFENEESLHLKAHRIVDLLGAKACVAAFHVEYDAGRNACAAAKHSNSRLTELASALHDKEQKLITEKPPPEGSSPPHREGRMGQAALHGGFLICILSEKPPSPIQLPQRTCSLTVYQHVFYDRTTDRVMPRDAASFRDFVDLSKRDVTSRLVGAFDDVGFTVPWASDRLYPGRFARTVATWCRDYALNGVAFLTLNFSALQRAEPSIRALNNMSTARPLVVLGVPRTDDPLILNRIAPLVDVIVFLTHHTGPTKPCRVTFPSSRMRMIDSSIFLRQTAQLTNQLVRIHRNLAGVCVAANMAVLKFSLPPRHSDLDDSCIDEEQVNYAQVCTWEGNVEYDTVSSAVLSRKHSNVLTYENEYSLETKARSYLSYAPLGCVAAFNADYEDSRGTCRQAFSRLAALDNVLGKRNRSRAPEPGTPHRGVLICVPSSTQRAPVDFPFSQCDVFVDGEVEYLYNNVIKTSSYKANLQGRLLDAKLNWTCFVVSLDATKLLSNLADSAAAREKIISFIANWLSTEGLCGLAVKESGSTQPVKGLGEFLEELSNEFSERDPKPVLILLVSAFEPEIRLKELSKYPDFLVLTNEVPNESKDCKLHGTMTATTDMALKLSMSRLLELSDSLSSKGGVCFSTTLAVYRYRLHQGLHGAGESCRRMVETTFGEACPPEESDRLVEVSSMTSYTYNKSHMLAFEDERSLRMKIETFLSRYHHGCVVAFDADMDTATNNCTVAKHFERLKTLRLLLGRTKV